MKHSHYENSVSGDGFRRALVRREQTIAKPAAPPSARTVADVEPPPLKSDDKQKAQRK